MSKVFTITEGLENLGALKTGGQGSVYKARRTGTMITAVKLLPTPLHSENPEDKNYRDFLNEVEKLKKVNETPNPNVVRILSSGITDSGSFPFIEMEFIEGPDLEDLLKPPHDPVFTIKEIIRVAEHLANALAHCHRLDVRHGDVKSNNVKFNIHTGNYVLLDFGLAIMSDEQRRTSLRHAGAIEFMAPEQSNGTMLFQSDIYSFGIIIYELLAGRVPFPLQDRSETSRNQVLVAHLEKQPPDVQLLRQEHLPAGWPEDRKEHELYTPLWLFNMIRKCLQKDPSARFANGMELYDYIHKNSVMGAAAGGAGEEQLVQLRRENKKLKEEKEQLQQVVQRLQHTIAASGTAKEAPGLRPPLPPAPVKKKSSRGSLLIALIIIALIALFFWMFAIKHDQSEAASSGQDSTSAADPVTVAPVRSPKKGKARLRSGADSMDRSGSGHASSSDPDQPVSSPSASDPSGSNSPAPGLRYKVRAGRAYFHDSPDRSTRRNAYMIPSDETFSALAEQGDFVYIEFTNAAGQTSRGWLLKEDLSPVE